ncbi:hypothetical protein JCM8547_008006 [Rhodosporidiobolus lusitaniae]
MPLDRSTVVDLSLYTLLCSVAALPLLQSLSSPSHRSQTRDLVRTLSKALALVLGGGGLVVLTAGSVLMLEKSWGKVKGWWENVTGRKQRGE